MQLNRIQCDRRTFLQLSMSGAAATAAPLSLISERPFTQMFSQVAPAASSSDNLLERMTWLNEPASSRRSGDQLLVRSRSKTDFWRKTLYGYITDNGHFFGLAASGDFMFQARVNGEYGALYDQAGLMVRLNAENWMKCGTEFFDGRRHASVVFTRDFSDWSTMPTCRTRPPSGGVPFAKKIQSKLCVPWTGRISPPFAKVISRPECKWKQVSCSPPRKAPASTPPSTISG